MADVYLCAHCGSTFLLSSPHSFQCMDCGHQTGIHGQKLPKEPQFEEGFVPPYHAGIGGRDE